MALSDERAQRTNPMKKGIRKIMARLSIETPLQEERAYERLIEDATRRLSAMPLDQCPVDFVSSLTKMYLANSCGKCTPCRVGLTECSKRLDKILSGDGNEDDLKVIRGTAQVAYSASDCAIGFTSGHMLMKALDSFEDDFKSHIANDACSTEVSPQAPCRKHCPAHVDIPSYIACIREGRLDDALRVIRNDNPLPTVCGYVCEHPCEMSCRRSFEDDAVNICGLKRFAADNAQWSPAPRPLPDTGKTVGIIGGGPAGLTAAYYLKLMGHDVVIYDQREKLGGMTRYGIPDYRLPQDRLDADIDFILSTGIKVRCDCAIGTDISFEQVMDDHDAVFISIGSHDSKKLGCEGEDADGVLSAVEFLRAANSGNVPDFTGKRVCVVGGGNVAMDCTRTAKRLGASSVECVYRRRIVDMTALSEEIEEASAEGCQITQLQAPVAITTDSSGNVVGLVCQPQIIGEIGRGGRPAPYAADAPEHTIPCDIVIVAIGQAIDSDAFSKTVQTERGCIVVSEDSAISEAPSILYSGGDAVSGPATVIKAIAAGKVAAANIDESLGFAHDVFDHVDIPPARPAIGPCGRVELKNVNFSESSRSFDIAKHGMSKQEAVQESSRCLRCDHYGFGATCSQETLSW